MRAVFYGLGADGTVGANKNSVKIIAEDAGLYAQGYFVYDSHKSGAQTVSHLRFGPRADPCAVSDRRRPVSSPATSSSFLERQDVLRLAAPGATLLLNSPYGPDEVWDQLPRSVQQQIIDKKLRFFVIDAVAVAREVGARAIATNTVLQTCFFAISGVLPREQAIAHIKDSIREDLRRQGRDVVAANFHAVDARAGASARGARSGRGTSRFDPPATVPDERARVRPRRDRAGCSRAGATRFR